MTLFRLFSRKPKDLDPSFADFLLNLLGFTPRKWHLYQDAMRHKSAAVRKEHGRKNSNERLEFLGDAVLDSIVAEYLFTHFKEQDEGFLTKTRAKFVGRTYLNNLAVELGIDQHIESNLEAADKSNTINGNALEALIGAIYLDQGYGTTRKWVESRLIGESGKLEDLAKQETDFKSKLIEWTQKEKKRIRFEVKEDNSQKGKRLYEAHVIVDDAECGKGIASSKKKAEQRAAGDAWKKINP
ncbi:MAG: ribonuclease III [Salibacteraceae bacterium]